MMTQLSKSIQLTRYHVGLVIIIIGILIAVIWRYFVIMEARVESFAFYNNVQLIERMFDIQQWLDKNKQTCAALDKPDLFQQLQGGIGPETVSLDDKTKDLVLRWHYNAKQHALTYDVQSQDFFRSKLGQKIILTFTCEAGGIHYNLSPYNWCQDMTFWGCKKW